MKKILPICLLFCLCQFFIGAKGIMESEQIEYSEKFAIDVLNTLEVDLSVEDFELNTHNENNIKIEITGEAPDKDISSYIVFSADNGKFSIKSVIKSIEILKRYNLLVKLYLPDKELDNCLITTSTGDITIDKLHSNITKIKSSTGEGHYGTLTGRVVNLNSSTGDKFIENINCKVVNIKSSTGDLEIDNIYAERVVLTSSTGKKFINNIESGESVIKSSTGNTVIEEVSGDISVAASSGNVSLGYKEFIHDIIDIHTSTGDIDILLPGDSEFFLNLDTKTGNIKCDFPVTVTGDKSNKSLKGDVTTGDNNVFGHAEVLISTQTGNIAVSDK